MLEQCGRVVLVEGQIGLADLGQLPAHSMAAPGNREIGAGGQQQMNIGWKDIDEATQIRDEHGIRKVVEVVKDDDHLGQLGHLGFECFEQWRAEPASVQRNQGAEVGKVRIDGTETLEESLRETDGVVVVF